ncbi:DNA polymerase nu [Xyrichtys novacula]|uniref:DNA-directed DNA polymerase n=1 Tax=Xyrichtys novacula TaxID=13765 RepID=A0AAV1HKG0_XYRNO|nr:DNA polymerase nu [Xyrichtys novacula]
MEQSSSRLYSGPLSQAAQKILAVLRAESLHETRRIHGHSYNHRQRGGFYGVRRESGAQSSWSMSQEESKDRDTERGKAFRPQPAISFSQTPTHSLSSPTSSCSPACWDSTLQGETEAKRDTLCLFKYPSIFEDTCLGNFSEDFRPSFTLSLSPDIEGADEVLFPATEGQNTHKEEPFFAHQSVSSCFNVCAETDKDTSFPHKEKRDIKRYEIASDSQEKWRQPLYSHIEEATKRGGDGGVICQQPHSETVKTGEIHPLKRQKIKLVREEGRGGKLSSEHVMQGEHAWTERLQRHETIANEKRSAEEIRRLWLLNINETTSSEQLLNPYPIMDKSLDGDTQGEKPREEEKVVFETRINLPAVEEVEHPPPFESKEQPVGCQTDSPEEIPVSTEGEELKLNHCQAVNTQDTGHIVSEAGERRHSEGALEPCETSDSLPADNVQRTKEERAEVMDVALEVETECSTKGDSVRSAGDKMETEQRCFPDKLAQKQGERDDEVSELPEGDTESGEREGNDESALPHVDRADECTHTGKESCSVLQESRGFRAPCLHENRQHHDDQTANGGIRGSSSSMALDPASTFPPGQNSSTVQGLDLSVIESSEEQAERNQLDLQTQAPLIPFFPLKHKLEISPQEKARLAPKIHLPKFLLKWEPPRPSQEKTGDVDGLKGALLKTPMSELQATSTQPQNKESHSRKSGKIHKNLCALKRSQQMKQLKAEESCDFTSATCKPPKHKRTRYDPDPEKSGLKLSHPGSSGDEPQKQPKAGCLTASLTSDPRVKDSGRMNSEEKMQVLMEAGKAKALLLTLVYQDGTTQLDPEQKLTPPVCGLLVLMKNNLDCSTPADSLGPNDSLVYLKLEQTPAWAQQHTPQSQQLFTRDMLLQVLSGPQLVVCFKAKDLLHTALQVYRGDLSWKQVAGCHIQDPQVSGWLLDPASPSSCFQELLNKHYKRPCATPALGTKKVSQAISGLYSLHWLNMELCYKLQSRGLWELFSFMELNMISVLAAMESHHIHVDKDALKRTSNLLGTKMKQLEQEAHRAAGQIFLVTSNAQLRTVLFEKLCLHERCENKKLPKTINKQQSTSEAALLQLQDLHPLPKIILEYRQVHKIKSTFVDGILSCMMSKNYISSTWHQTSVVTGRISAKHPNFQALPRQPLRITKKQYIQGKEKEVVTVHPRAMFIPKDGWTFLSADFCQVELRLLAHLSSDPELLRIFINPQADVFTMLASQWKGVSEGEVTSEDREHAKRVVYSVVYGAGRERLSGILGVSAEQASRFQDSFLQTYREVQTFIQRTIQQCHKQGYVLSIMGRQRTLPNINSPDWGVRMQAERQAVNFVVQGSAADLCKMAMIRISNLVSSSASLSARLLAQLHDELLFEVEDSQVEQFAVLVRSTMESLQHIDQLGVHLQVPLKVAVSCGKSWGSMSELNIPPTCLSPL